MDWIDRYNYLESQYDRLEETLKMLLRHQAETDTILVAIKQQRKWWELTPRPTVPADIDVIVARVLAALKNKL